MSVLLQVSDPHFGTEQTAVMAALQTLVSELRPQVVVLSGDITQRATVLQFEAARRWLERLQVPHRLLLPGNHDIPLFHLPLRVFAPYRRYLRGMVPGSLAPTVIADGFHVIGVNTTRRWRHVDGEVSARQISEVEAGLMRADRASLRIVVTHQPLWVTREVDVPDRCHGADAALPRWCAAGAQVFLAGHIHYPFVAALPHEGAAWAVNAGTALSHRVRDGIPNSVNLIRRDAQQGAFQVERWDYHAESARFICAQLHRLDQATSPETQRVPEIAARR